MARVLIIDDDASVRDALAKILLLDGHTVEKASDGRSALSAVAARPPDLVVTDIYMPEMDGIEFLLHLSEAAPDIPVIAVSGGATASAGFVLQDASQLGAAATLAKPFEIDDVRSVVRDVLERHPPKSGARG
jgi:two-component system response regulator HydG